MLMYLVALVIVPALAMPVFAMLFSFDRLEDAASARRIADGMQQIVDYEEVRTALRDEALEAGIRSIAVQLDLTIEEVNANLGELGAFPVPATDDPRVATDAALAVVGADEQGGPAHRELVESLVEARSVVDAALQGSGPGADDVWTVYLRYNDVYDRINAAQQQSIRAILVGDYGDSSGRVLNAAAELALSRELSEVLFRQMSAVQGLATAPGLAEQRDLIDDIDTDRRVSAARLESLPASLSGDALDEWQELVRDPDFVMFDEFLGAVVDGSAAPSPDGLPGLITVNTPGFIETGAAVIPVSVDIGDLMGRAVNRGVLAAQDDEARAVTRARVAVITTVGLLVVTCAGLVIVGGTLRRELLRLATAAGRLRTGRLEQVPVEGPREIAQVAEALNDAVANLGQVATQAEALAAGQLEDPALQEPVPGDLGAAVHASVGRVVDAVRELERLRGELTHQAAHDRLTGLVNRAEGERLLAQALDRAHRTGTEAAVLFVDLDDFKHINDTLGHAAGDQVLITAAERMVGCVRPDDAVCRLGGDEFVVILEDGGQDLTVDHATEVANRIVTSLAEPIRFHGMTILTGASIGIALAGDLTDPSVLQGNADTAMYRAKAQGPHGVEVYDATLDGSGLPRRRTRGPAAAGAPERPVAAPAHQAMLHSLRS